MVLIFWGEVGKRTIGDKTLGEGDSNRASYSRWSFEAGIRGPDRPRPVLVLIHPWAERRPDERISKLRGRAILEIFGQGHYENGQKWPSSKPYYRALFTSFNLCLFEIKFNFFLNFFNIWRGRNRCLYIHISFWFSQLSVISMSDYRQLYLL